MEAFVKLHRRLVLLVAAGLFLVTGLFAAPNISVHAASFRDQLVACPEGFILYSQETLDAGQSDTVKLLPAPFYDASGVYLVATGPGAFAGQIAGKWTTPQPVGAHVFVIMSFEVPFPGIAARATIVQPTCASFYSPGDSRVAPDPGERIVAYCNTSATPPNVDVWIVDGESHGKRLTTFNFKDIVAAGPKGLYRTVNPYGVVSIMVDSQNNFWLALNGGLFKANGQGSWAKGFKCDFAR
jgi:hypothetical protein